MGQLIVSLLSSGIIFEGEEIGGGDNRFYEKDRIFHLCSEFPAAQHDEELWTRDGTAHSLMDILLSTAICNDVS